YTAGCDCREQGRSHGIASARQKRFPWERRNYIQPRVSPRPAGKARAKTAQNGVSSELRSVPQGEFMKREFASLSAQEALHVAIFIEERNAEIYHQFAEMFAEFRDPESLEIASTFWDMATEERRHGTQLQKRYFDRYGTRPCAVTEDDIRE